MTLGTAELNAMRDTVESHLASVCNVITVERSRDNRGNVTEVVVTGPDFACHVVPMALTEGSRESELAGQITALAGFKVLHPHDVDLSVRDRLVVDVDGATRTLEVVVARAISTNAIVKTAVAVEAP